MTEVPRLCTICGKRRPKRFCPGVRGDICPVCCGTEREVTVSCPLDCVYLQDSRKHETPPAVDPRQLPNGDIRVNEDFLRRNESLIILLSSAIARSALSDHDVVDNDVKEALDSLVRTYRTLQSGLVYETRPVNPLARRVYSGVEDGIADIRRRLAEHGQSIRDADLLGVFAFLQRLEIQYNNGRRKGRAFIDFLRGFFPPKADAPPDPGSLILTP